MRAVKAPRVMYYYYHYYDYRYYNYYDYYRHTPHHIPLHVKLPRKITHHESS
jgi:hypothetical protein